MLADDRKESIAQFRVMPLDNNDWRNAYYLANRHAVIGAAWDGIINLQTYAPELTQNISPDMMGKWFADVKTIEAANRRLELQTAQLQEFLQKGGFESRLLKGASFAFFYPDPAHRQAADIDMWVLPKPGQSRLELRHALLAYLRSCGIQVGEIVYHHIQANIYTGTEVELHVTPSWLYNPIHNHRLQMLFTLTGQLTPQIQELCALMHAFRHIYHDGLTLRHVLDYWLIANANKTRNESVPVALYAQLGLATFANAMNELCELLFAWQQSENASAKELSKRARHLLEALPQRQVSKRIQWDYPSETLWAFPWRTAHFLWRKTISK